MLRTHTCGELTRSQVGKKVTLCGWIDSIRIQGRIGFINIRDRYGKTQVFLPPSVTEKVKDCKKESVIQVKGLVKARPPKLVNKEMKTGTIELSAESVELLNPSEPLPLDISGGIESTDETRLKYRFVDLRNQKMQHNIIMRHKVIKAIRDYMDNHGFLEVETPVLAKSTPEGARDYLVPSRRFQGNFYALPQSPQLFKQLLMVGGFDKYFQIAKCMRDEDLRADRQPEFTQLDVEMSFIGQEDIFKLMEGLMTDVFKKVLNVNLKFPFPRMTYADAMKKYKTDKPDIRKKKNEFAFLWVTDFPLLEYDEKEKRWVSCHHPFTGLKKGQEDVLAEDPKKVISSAYDLVLNGFELGSGSIRIHDKETQLKVFKTLNIDEKEAKEKFGFLLNAFRYGAPPHGGIALGLDRVIAIITGNGNIREVIAFPKNKDGRDLMLDAPSKVSDDQLKELGIKTR